MSIAIQQSLGAPAAAATPSGTPPQRGDGYLDTVSKLVPGEVIVAFAAALQLPGVDHRVWVHLVILGCFTALTPLVLFAAGRRTRATAPLLQYAVRTLAFVMLGLSTDAVLVDWLDDLRFIPGLGTLVVVLLAAAILAPPGAQGPPAPPTDRSKETP